MKNLNEKLSEALDIEPIEFEVVEPIVENTTPVVVETPVTNSVVEEDTEFARKNIKDLISKGTTAMDNLLQIANASEHPRAFEVAAGLIKNLADMNKDLLDIQKKKKDLSPKSDSSSSAGSVNVSNAVFVGNTNELIRLLKNK